MEKAEKDKEMVMTVVDLKPIFYPRSIALVRISPSHPDNLAMDFAASLL